MFYVTTTLTTSVAMDPATHCQLGKFDSNHKEWGVYIKQLQRYFTANDVHYVYKQRQFLAAVKW